jgi:nucleotide-binding universal stress UspA family protein
MEKKILLVVDGSIHSTRAVEYAVRVSSVVQNLTYTLFNIQPTISQYLLDESETDIQAKSELRKVARKNAEIAQGILEKHKSRMVGTGISERRIETVTQKKVLGICKDILDFAQEGLYDAILVGRRGLSRIEQTFMGSTTAGLVEHSSVIPVWVVDGDVQSMAVMLSVDGSKASLRAVDHLTFMLGGNEKMKVTMFHVTPTLGNYCVIDFDEKESEAGEVIARGAKQCIENFYAQAQKKFKQAGFHENQITLKVVKRTMDVGKAIVGEAKKGDYGTVVVGRRGVNEAFFMGSVSRYVLDKTSDRALWVIS